MAKGEAPYSILFVCRHNAVRSQVAEALARHIAGDAVNVESAGTEPAAIPLFVIDWAARLGIDHSRLRSKSLSEVADRHFDTIVTLCDKSHTALPEHPQDIDHVRWNFSHPDDPASLRKLEIELSERLRVFMQAKHLI